MLSIAEQNQGYINFAIMLENRALKKGITTKWRDFSVVCYVACIWVARPRARVILE